MKKPDLPRTPDHDLVRFTEIPDMMAGIKDRINHGWHLHSWHPAVEMFEQVDNATGHRDRWPVTVFYAMFWQQPEVAAPAPMAAR